MKHHVIGIDFGTLSARALLLDAVTGEELASALFPYPHGVLDTALPCGRALEPSSAYQDPTDYLAALRTLIPEVCARGGVKAEEIAGLGVDFTTCTMLPIRKDGTPLCTEAAFASDPHAWVKLWKHHASSAQAERISALAREKQEPFFAFYGGKTSAEWMLPKILETLEKAPAVFDAADRFIEAGDWISLMLTGKETHAPAFAHLKASIVPGRPLPSREFLSSLHPHLADLYAGKLSPVLAEIGQIAGRLNERGASITALPVGTPLSLPILDAGAAMPALGITEEGEMLVILGTSGVLMMNHKECKEIPGICGCLGKGILPDLYTYEAGVSAIGDIFDWYLRTCLPSSEKEAAEKAGISVHAHLRAQCENMAPGESGLLALDWFNGDRCVLNDAAVSGTLLGMTLGTRPAEIYRALIEATAFGMRRAATSFAQAGMKAKRLCAAGGIARKDPMLMQIYADVFGQELVVSETKEAGARGAAIYASHAAGLYPSLASAICALASRQHASYKPIPAHVEAYERLYALYCALQDEQGRNAESVMKRLLACKEASGLR